MSESKKLSGILLSLLVLAIFAMPAYAAGMPQINITEPKNGSVVSSGNVTVSVDVENFNIVNKQGTAKAAGEGHIHYFMDVRVPTTPDKPSVTAEGTYAHVINKSYTWMNVKPGKHNLSVELVNNDHTPLTPPVISMVNVTVMGAGNMTSATARAGSNSVVVNVAAKSIAFNTSTITVPTSADVTINFDNQDSGVQHNIAVYTNSSAKTSIYVGKLITGPAKTTYTFKAPSMPGTYFFRCDTHPMKMTGRFLVQ